MQVSKWGDSLAVRLPKELVEKLGSPNGWVQDTAQRLLVERANPNVIAVQTAPVCQGVERSELKMNTTNSEHMNITPTSGAMYVKASKMIMLMIDWGTPR